MAVLLYKLLHHYFCQLDERLYFCRNYCIITSVIVRNVCASVHAIGPLLLLLWGMCVCFCTSYWPLLLPLWEMCVLLYKLMGHYSCYCEECMCFWTSYWATTSGIVKNVCFCTSYWATTSVIVRNVCPVQDIGPLLSLWGMCMLLYMLLGHYFCHCEECMCFCTSYWATTSVIVRNVCASVQAIGPLLLSLWGMCVLLYMLV